MNPPRRRPGKPTAVDLYAGSGAVTAGLRRAGFRVVAAVDNDPVAGRTYKANHPTVRLYQADIRKIDPHRIRRCDLHGRNADLLIVCAPCQPFSSQNRKRGGDPRAQLILQATRFAEVLRPRLIFFENVPGLATAKNRSILAELRGRLRKAGYTLGDPVVVDAADHGVPQRRVRCIMFATQGHKCPGEPRRATPEGGRRTVREAIGHLRRLASGECDPADGLHRARIHQPIALERLSHIKKDGGSRSDLPSELVLPCHRDHKGHPDVYGRMKWNDVAPTLTTGCTDLTRGRFGHPEDDRAITPREAALLQTFPPDYRFRGSPKQVATQVGNAVPVRLIEAFGPTFHRALWRMQRRLTNY